MSKGRPYLSILAAILLGGFLYAAPIGVPRYTQVHDDAFRPWFEGVLTNLYDETGSYLLTYDDLENHSNIYAAAPPSFTVWEINKGPAGGAYEVNFSETDYQNIIDGKWFCAPTSAANVLAYWSDNGYSNLVDTEVNVIGDLAMYMGNCGLGKTSDDGFFNYPAADQSKGIFRYVDAAGYLVHFNLATYSFAHIDFGLDTSVTDVTKDGYTWTTQSVYAKGYGDEGGVDVYKNEIDNNRPVYISGRRALFGHAVTGVGYTEDKIIVNNYGSVEYYDWDCISGIKVISFVSPNGTKPPDSPANLVVEVSDDSTTASLSWSDIPDATAYNVYRSTTSGELYCDKIATVTTNSHTDEDLAANTTYYYRITALDGSNKTRSDSSAEVTITTESAPPPGGGGGGGGCFLNTAVHN